jgi:hypothetical protein
MPTPGNGDAIIALLWQIVPKVLEKFGAWDVAPATEKLKGTEFATGGGA